MWGLKIFSIILISSLKINAVIFNCEFSTNSCTITNGTISSKSDATVTSITGTYPSGTTSNSITVIDGRGVEICYFPLGLTKYFPNIDVIFFEANSVQYECKYEAHEYYWCKVQSGKILKKSEVEVTNVFGTHVRNKANNDVQFFDARGILTRYFPRSLDKFFPNIIETYFEDGMREIHKEDLKQFPKLRSFFMSNSNVEYLEKDLFIYNPNLVLVFFNLNNIKYVDPHVFDNLKHLTYLGFDRNFCHSGLVENNRQKALDLIQEINENCSKKLRKHCDVSCGMDEE
ncbi:hypothetical protein PVAND_000459 [Polypedilum vanderplanki]|uniref:Uncharacterized protein n=1 Tax=Polypedilum vanderplanki TaxID=319348 RepID=A0A9J6BL10_POLVA|nr:hypothetical protein PVAND_000459 [Polypedilum vanderplanki]